MMKHFLLLALLLSGLASKGHAADTRTQNVILITTDGLRWQEVFQGAEEILLSKQWGSISDTNAARALWWRPTPEERRAVLFPFLWGTVAKQGQLFGNRTVGSDVRVTNGRNFSYPGYSEFLTGHPDPAIDSNDKKLNANTNVFEWLNAKPAFAGRVAAVVNWDVLPWILNAPRAGFPVWTGFEVPAGTQRLSVPSLLTEVVDHGRTVWNGVLLDTFVRSAAFHTVREMKPRALYVSYGETDDWAHEGNYERYLRSAHNFDRFLGELWALCQSMPEYRDRTSFVLSTDHGRGPAPVAWKSHGAEIPESAYMWMAVLGPDTPPLGERHQVPLIKQAQIASTVAALVGENFQTVSPNNAPPVTEAFSAPRP